jgi:asparagine synthase (glutamine-hydrolysing)
MLGGIRHRGPDDEGQVTLRAENGATVVLAHARLSIIDTSAAGHQPMGTFEGPGARAITFNGEIFNFATLKRDLAAQGSVFRGGSDTEVLLEASRVWGEERAVERMMGMFAWALADAGKGTVWLCRDRLGVKPLYWTRTVGGGVLFASELRALLAAGRDLVPRTLSSTALESFLAQGMVCGDETLVEGIHLLAPGTSLTLDWSGRERSHHRYWQIQFPAPSTPISRNDAVSRLAEMLREAVHQQLVSDVPLGLFLSGGVDSSALTALATEVNPNVRTVSVGFDEAGADETAEAEALARHFRTEHQTVRVTGAELLDDVDDVFRAMDQPTVDGFNTFVVSRAARRSGLTVALSGVGGDELFGGYASFRDVPSSVHWGQRLRWARGVLNPASHVVGVWNSRKLAKVAEAIRRPSSIVDMYFLRRELFLTAERRALLSLPAGAHPLSGVPADYQRQLEARTAGLDDENAVSCLELGSYMQHMLLRDADVFSMANGLEVRVPLIDHRVVDFVTQLPGAWKRPNGKPKALLVDAVGPRLPAEVWQRPKHGFTFPWAAWLRGPMRAKAQRTLKDQDIWRGIGLDVRAPMALWERFLRGDGRVSALQLLALWALGTYVQRHELTRAS